MIAAGAVVVALLIWVALISPQNSKLSSLHAKQSQLTTQQTALEARLTALKSEKQGLSANCADLAKIAAQIPSVQNPTDVDAEESSFESQFNGLTASSGVTLTQFSGFTPANGAATTTPSTAGSAAGSAATSHAPPSDVTAVPTTLAVTGSFGQMTAFINGLDSFPRLFVIQTFTLSYGTSVVSSGGSASTSSGGSVNAGQAPLWTGGSPNAAGAGPYTLAITGSIYYTSSPNALDACTKATSTLK